MTKHPDYGSLLCEQCCANLEAEHVRRYALLSCLPFWRRALLKLLVPERYSPPRFRGDKRTAILCRE